MQTDSHSPTLVYLTSSRSWRTATFIGRSCVRRFAGSTPMSFGGLAASTSGWCTRPGERGIGSTGCAGRNRGSLLTGLYAMATAEHREPCDSRGSCTVLRRDMLWSPTIRAALLAGTPWLDVFCPGCGTSRAIDLRKVDRHPLASVATLVLGLRCSWCPESAPMPRILGLYPLPPAAKAAASNL
jgi:hypothetical protein